MISEAVSDGKALRAEALTLDVSRTRALGPFTFDVEVGETVVLLGANGSGKTTALRLSLGLVRSSSGRSVVHGQPVSPTRPPKGVGYVPDRAVFHDWDTAEGNLRLLHGNTSMIIASLERVGLVQASNRRVRSFSRGMRQRLSLARALAAHPELLVMDEPTIALDAEGINMLLEVIRERQVQGLSALIATHDRDFQGQLQARLVRLENGAAV